MEYSLLTMAEITKIQDNLSDIRSGNLEKLSDRKKNLKCYHIFRIAIKNLFICLTCLLQE
jgi:hypothetical protein